MVNKMDKYIVKKINIKDIKKSVDQWELDLLTYEEKITIMINNIINYKYEFIQLIYIDQESYLLIIQEKKFNYRIKTNIEAYGR